MNMRPSHIALAAILALSGGLISAGCGDPEPAAKPAADTVSTADTAITAGKALAAGRYQIPTAHTPVPDLFITLPDGYTIHDQSRMPDDQVFIIQADDPSMNDSAAVTPGFLRVYVGVNPQTGLAADQKYTEQNLVLGGRPLTWKLWTQALADKSPYYLREITSSDFFASLSPELAKAPLNLHIYIAGADSVRVTALMKAAQTLSFAP